MYGEGCATDGGSVLFPRISFFVIIEVVMAAKPLLKNQQIMNDDDDKTRKITIFCNVITCNDIFFLKKISFVPPIII